MTEEQALKRWKFRHDYLEFWLVTLLVGHQGHNMKSAVDYIRAECERQMKMHGYNYPLEKTDP